jgi:hypothetical protein
MSVSENPKWWPATAILNYEIYFHFQACYLGHLQLHLYAKFGENWIICNKMAAYYVKFKMVAVAAILDFGL